MDQYLIQSAEEALNVFELEANRSVFRKYYTRHRRLVDVNQVDTTIKLFGETWKSPIFLCPASGQMAFHDEGEVAVVPWIAFQTW